MADELELLMLEAELLGEEKLDWLLEAELLPGSSSAPQPINPTLITNDKDTEPKKAFVFMLLPRLFIVVLVLGLSCAEPGETNGPSAADRRKGPQTLCAQSAVETHRSG